MDGLNGRQKTDYATALLRAYMLRNGRRVFTPESDHGSYDVLVSAGESYERVQVKWSSHTHDGGYPRVSLRVLKSRKNGNSSKRYSRDDFDSLWACTPSGCFYITVSQILEERGSFPSYIAFYPKYDKYKVNIPTPGDTEVETIYETESPFHMTENHKKATLVLREQGWTYQDIGQVLGYSRQAIGKFIRSQK